MKNIKNLDPVAAGIRAKIAERGLLKKAVAERAGFTVNQFSDMLNGRRVIKACDLLPISDALGIELADLLMACKPKDERR